MKSILISSIIAINLYYVIILADDLWRHRHQVMTEPANNYWSPITSAVIYFFSTLGISDFALSTAIYHKTKWVSLKKLPGTLNTQCVIPTGVMAIIMISNVKVGLKTLIICVACQTLGAYLGTKFVTRLPQKIIKNFIIAGLLIACGFILAGKLNLIVTNGTATQLSGSKLILTGGLLFIFGALDDIGIGCYAPTMATIYAVGMNPIAAFPIMMCSSTFSLAISGVQFIKLDDYSRKLTLFSVAGVLGVIIAAFIFKHLAVSGIEWLVIIILIYSAFSLLHSNNAQNKKRPTNLRR